MADLNAKSFSVPGQPLKFGQKMAKLEMKPFLSHAMNINLFSRHAIFLLQNAFGYRYSFKSIPSFNLLQFKCWLRLIIYTTSHNAALL